MKEVRSQGDDQEQGDQGKAPPKDAHLWKPLIANNGYGQLHDHGCERSREKGLQPPRHEVQWALTTYLAPALKKRDQR